MPKFLMLYRSSDGAEDRMNNSAPEDMQDSMQAWIDWKDQVETSFKFEFGMPLQIRQHFGAAGSESDVSGYSTIEGDDMDGLHKAIAMHPHLSEQGASIDVLEMLPMPGM